jgi:excisionase family DNA binding protein
MTRPERATPEMLRNNPPTLLTQGEAAQFAGMRKDHLRSAIKAGRLPHVMYEDRVFVRTADLKAWLEAIRIMTTPATTGAQS